MAANALAIMAVAKIMLWQRIFPVDKLTLDAITARDDGLTRYRTGRRSENINALEFDLGC
jgi:hypothetical protein